MKFKTVAQATKDLEALAKQLGASRFEDGRKSYLSSNVITDEDGNVLEPGQYEINVTVEKAASDEPKADFASEAKSITDAIKSAVREVIADRGGVSVSKAASIQVGGNDTRKDTPRGRVKFLKSVETAHAFGNWIIASALGHAAPRAMKFCKERGYSIRFGDWESDDSDRFIEKSITGHSEAVNADGGFLVPLEFDTELVWLRERYGVFRQYSQVKNMSSDRLEFLRKNSSHTAYFVAEGATNTTSKMNFTRLGLTAKKLRADGYLTQELSDDAAIALGDEAARDIAEVFALKEDQCGFNGDGTSTYGGIVGLTQSFLNLGTVSNSVGIYDSAAAGTGATYDAITLPGIMAWRSRLPAYADNPNARIFCHKTFYHAALERLAANAGGSTLVDIGTGMATPMFMGTPVVFCQALPATPTANVPDAFYGDLSKCATFGSRKGVTFKTTDVGGNAWENDEIAYKAIERFDINVHDVGNNTSTAADQKAGPVVALIVA